MAALSSTIRTIPPGFVQAHPVMTLVILAMCAIVALPIGRFIARAFNV